ncbi:hypothetical protein B4U80_05819, partial [Leptotrombidium deliense]
MSVDSFKVFNVPKGKQRFSVKKLLENKKVDYWKGCAFYELTKAAFVDQSSNVAVEEIKSGKVFDGNDARKLLKLKFTTAKSAKSKKIKLNPEDFEKYRLFLSALAPNKVLDSGSKLLYKFEPKKAPKAKRAKKGGKAKGPPVKTSTATSTSMVTPRTLSVGDYNDIQIVFSYDTTGSMSGCIAQVQKLIKQTISRLISSVPNISIAVIAHGDYCDEDYYYLLKYMDFTRDERSLCDFVTNVGHTGGGDFEEAYEYVLNKVRTSLSWRENASKSLVLIADATPHKPNDAANKSKLDWRKEAKGLHDKGIKVYAVKCLGWNDATPFYKELASITAGFYLELHQFTAITDFMIAISFREGNFDQLQQFRTEIETRNRGVLSRNYRQMFATLTGESAGEDAESTDLTAVEPGRFQILDVDRDDSIKNFVTRNGARFKVGKGFYEFMKPEEIQEYKEVVLMDKTTGDMFTGDRARELANIADHVKGRKIKPPPSDKWTMFIQSTSYNRKLIGGTKFLYEASRDA